MTQGSLNISKMQSRKMPSHVRQSLGGTLRCTECGADKIREDRDKIDRDFHSYVCQLCGYWWIVSKTDFPTESFNWSGR